MQAKYPFALPFFMAYLLQSPYLKSISLPIYGFDFHSEIAEHHATGTLVAYRNKNFLCTAGHAVSQKTHALTVSGGNGSFLLRPFRRSLPGNDKKSGKVIDFDFAATELKSEQAIELRSYNRFLSLDPETPYRPFEPRAGLCAYGYLNAHNAELEGNILTRKCVQLDLSIQERVLEHDPKRAKFRNKFIAGIFDPSLHGGTEKEFKKIDYNGMSGGPIFYKDFLQPAYHFELAGILLESARRKDGRHAFIGLSSRQIILYLHKWWFPDIPMPTIATTPWKKFSSL